MTDASPPFRAVVLHPDAARSAVAARITGSLPGVKTAIAELPPRDHLAGGDVLSALPRSKEVLFVTRHRGRLLKPCPGTPGYTCCGYRVLNLVTGCPLDCTYCILQIYLDQPAIVVHSDWENAIGEIESLARSRPGRTLRIGTGELADSLALEPLTGMARDLIPLALRRREVVLEFKTKTTRVDNLLDVDHRGRVVLSWSVNAGEVSASEEKGAPPLESRLQAARACRRAGYRIGLHFDPIVRFDGWREGYSRALEAVYDHLAAGDLAWISLGALRYPAALDAVVRRRFPGSRIPLGELVPGLDGKLRYFRPLRVEMFRHLYSQIRKRDGCTPVYLCMESPEVWRSSLGGEAPSPAVLSRRLDEAAAT